MTAVVRYAGVGDEAASDINGQLAAIAALNWHAIELRTVDGVGIADLAQGAFDRVAARVAEAGTAVVAVDSGIGNWARPIDGEFARDLAELSTLAHRAPALGTRFVRVMSYPNAGLCEAEWARLAVARIRALALRAEDAGLTLLHENCAGWAGDRAERMLRLLDATGGRGLQLLFDTGNGLAHGYEGYDLLRQVVDHVAHVHVKDAVRTAGGVCWTVPGNGSGRVLQCLELLLTSGYRGALSIEPHLAVRPHDGVMSPSGPEPFLAAGAALEHMLRAHVAPQWRATAGGLEPAPAAVPT